MKRIWMMAAALGLLMGPGFSTGGEIETRAIPRPLASHPGNIFLAGKQVSVAAPSGGAGSWRAMDYEGKTVAEGQGGHAELGKLPVGYYELAWSEGVVSNRVSLGVLEPLRAPTPLTSPIGIDVAMAWFFPKESMAAPANLCALAGMNRVRDRLSWPELEPKRGEFAADTRYDASAQAQVAAGLKVLQVGHASPPWASPNPMHFPPDLRDIHAFCREMARRWHGQIEAFEPWNEADIKEFGGHTGSEMATLQKAAYLGLKAGNPKVIACLNVFAIHRAATLADFGANEAWPYFDTFNLHHYEQLQGYPKLYADFRAVSGGKPMWVTECSVRVKWQGDERLKELSEADLRLQGERVTKTYVLALHQGAGAVFYFMLPHYSEGLVQYGLLHSDLTPRPGYLALAAVGRLLADARPLGRVELTNNAGQGYCFSARPDGQAAEVLVVWAQGEASLELPSAPLACFDHLGRPVLVAGKVLKVGPAPLYAVLAKGSHPALLPPPKPAKLLPGKPGPLVLQALLPEASIVLDRSAYKIPGGRTNAVPVFLYNFGAKKARGRLSLTVPEGWKGELPHEVEVAPGERKELTLNLACAGTNGWSQASIRITGDFGAEGRPVLAVRFVPESKPEHDPAAKKKKVADQ
jgi:hypothetical protein